jgi:dihydroorotate dehydrogenase electron transfer subunit
MLEPVEVAVHGVEHVGAYVVVHLVADGLEAVAPGRFAMVRDPAGRAFLPRPVGLFELDDGHLGVLVDPALAVGELARADRLRVLAPLGSGFDLDGARPETTLLVAGGIGITVFPDVPRVLGGRPRLIAGFRTDEQAAATRLVAADVTAVVAPRLVTELLDLDGVELVLAAGPHGMVRAVAERCAAVGVACQVALEAPMACGFGACYGCAVEIDGEPKRLCIEGPVVGATRFLACG